MAGRLASTAVSPDLSGFAQGFLKEGNGVNGYSVGCLSLTISPEPGFFCLVVFFPTGRGGDRPSQCGALCQDWNREFAEFRQVPSLLSARKDLGLAVCLEGNGVGLVYSVCG